METPEGRRFTLVAASREAIISTAAQIDGYAEHLRPVEPGDLLNTEGLDALVEHGVRELEELLAGHDALDVMTMLRQYVTPPDLAQWSESGSSLRDSWAAAEVVGLVLLGHDLPTRDPGCEISTESIVPELIDVAAVIVHLAAMRGLVRASWRTAAGGQAAGLSRLAWQLSSHETTVRGRQYPQVATTINERILRTARTEAAFTEALGFTYDQILAVRTALVDQGGSSVENALLRLQDAVTAGGPPPHDAVAAAQALFMTPSQLHLVTGEDLAQRTGMELPTVETIMGAFSIQPDGTSALDLVAAFCDGRNPMAGKAILHAPGRGYLPMPGAIALDEIRRTCETPMKKTLAWVKYHPARDRAAEDLVTDTLLALLAGKATAHRNLKYRDTLENGDPSPTSTTHGSAPLTEADALLVIDGVALCVETKAGDLRPKARQGGIAQLEGDLGKTVKDAARQADRLRSIIKSNRGLWLENGTWLDLEDVEEIHSIVVCLDDLGPLSLATAELVRAGVLPQVQLPWVVSVHDLLVTQHVLQRPEHFLTYLRRRTNRDAAVWVTGSDELDILMWYLAGGFYFVPDPDRLYEQHPKTKIPTAKQRREYADQGPTMVGTFTDSLDAHYYWEDGTSSQPADCPRRQPMDNELQTIVDNMSSESAPGWLRVAADLDGYSTQAQHGMAQNLRHTMAATAADGGFHTFATGGMDDTGRWIYIFASGSDNPGNREHLRQYVLAKKHSDHANRALGVLVEPDGNPRLTMWLAYPPQDDPQLDSLARSMRLIPPDRAPSAIPPKAKQAKKRRRHR